MSDNFEKLELNEENVLRLLKDCIKTDSTRKSFSDNFYSDKLKSKAPMLEFDIDKIGEHNKSINYLLGQLHAVHTHKETMSISYGIMDYKGNNWTKNNMALFALYYLGTASDNLPYFSQGNGGSLTVLEIQYHRLKPTFWPPQKEDREPGND